MADDGIDPPALRPSDWGRSAGASRAEAAADAVAKLASEVEPGTRLGTKDELRARCGVSVGTFNETLRLLQSRGVVTVQRGPRGGLFAAEQTPMARLAQSVLALNGSPADVSDALRIRSALEPLLWQDALWHGAPADIKDLRTVLERMKSAADDNDPDAFVRANWQLHTRIAAITPHAFLRSLYVSLLDLVEWHVREVRPQDGTPLAEYVRDRYRLHVTLVDALERRDKEAVLRLVEEHDTTDRQSMDT